MTALETTAAKPVTLKTISDFFRDGSNMTLKDFRNEWEQLTDADKEQIKSGLSDGTLTY